MAYSLRCVLVQATIQSITRGNKVKFDIRSPLSQTASPMVFVRTNSSTSAEAHEGGLCPVQARSIGQDPLLNPNHPCRPGVHEQLRPQTGDCSQRQKRSPPTRTCSGTVPALPFPLTRNWMVCIIPFIEKCIAWLLTIAPP